MLSVNALSVGFFWSCEAQGVALQGQAGRMRTSKYRQIQCLRLSESGILGDMKYTALDFAPPVG